MFTVHPNPAIKNGHFLRVNHFHKNSLWLQTPKSFHTCALDKDSPVLRNEKRWQCWMRWWEGWSEGGPWPAWPNGGIRFDWIGVGDLCIKLRLPCDPTFCREIHRAARGRARGGSLLTSCSVQSRLAFALLGFLTCVYCLIHSISYLILFYFNPLYSDLFCSSFSRFLYFGFCCLKPIQSVSFHCVQLIHSTILLGSTPVFAIT